MQATNTALFELTNLHLAMSSIKNEPEKDNKEEREIANRKIKDHRIDRLSRFLFPGAFCALNIIYFVYHRLNKHTVD